MDMHADIRLSTKHGIQDSVDTLAAQISTATSNLPFSEISGVLPVDESTDFSHNMINFTAPSLERGHVCFIIACGHNLLKLDWILLGPCFIFRSRCHPRVRTAATPAIREMDDSNELGIQTRKVRVVKTKIHH